MASLDDGLTTAKNIVTAINGLNSTIMRSLGNATSQTLTADTVVATSSGRLVNMVVVDGGSADGAIYNVNSAGNAGDINQLIAIPQTEGAYPIGVAFNSGLFVSPGTGQKINVTYYLG